MNITDINPDKYVSQLLVTIINEMNIRTIPYVFCRNYEDYPARITGDIDIFIAPNCCKLADSILHNVFEDAHWEIILKSNSTRMISYQLHSKIAPNFFRNMLVIELFKGFNLWGYEYYPFGKINILAKKYKMMQILPVPYGIIFSLIHYLTRAGFYPLKYSSKINNAFYYNNQKTMNVLSDMLSSRLSARIYHYISMEHDSDFDLFDNIPEKIRIVPRILRYQLWFELIKKSFLINPKKSLINSLCLVGDSLQRILFPKGVIIIIDALNKDDIAFGLLNEIKHLHLFKNSATILGMFSKLRLFTIVKCLHNGGAAIISLDMRPPSSKFCYFKLRILSKYTTISLREYLNYKTSVLHSNITDKVDIADFILFVIRKIKP